MLFPIKVESELLSEMMTDLESKTGINDFSPGSTARCLLEIFNNRLSAYYNYLDIYASMIFLSTSEGTYLDLIGEMLDCTRLPSEEDENYRYRISKQVYTAANANKTSLRLKCLSVTGVKNVVLTQFSRGSGSFSVHVITDEIETPDDVLAAVDAVVEETKAEGIRAVVTRPNVVPIDIAFSAVVGGTITTTSIASQIKSTLQDYIDTLGMGSDISIVKMLTLAGSNENITQLALSTFKVGGQQIVVRDKYQLEWDERAYIRNVTVSSLS